MAIIVPQTWTAIAAAVADYNTYVRDVTRQLQGHSSNPKPFAVVYSAADNVLTTGVFTTMAFDTVEVNRGGLWDGTTFTVPTGWAGLYHITANVNVDAYAGNKELRISINGVEAGVGAANIYGVGSPAFARLSCSADAWLAAGDTIDSIVFQDYPGDINALGGRLCNLSAFFVATAN